MASKWYGKGLLNVVNGTIVWGTTTIKAILVDASYTYNADHDFANDVSGNELSGTGYTGGFGGSGRKTITASAPAEDTTNDRIEYDLADLVWTGLNAGTIGGVVFVVETTNDAASKIIAFLDPTNLVTNGGDVTLVIDAEGALQISYA